MTDEGVNDASTAGSSGETAGQPPADEPTPPVPVGDEVPMPGQQLEAGEG